MLYKMLLCTFDYLKCVLREKMLRKITIQSNFMKPLTCIICMMKGFCIRMSHECGDLSDAYDACEKKIREVNGSGF